MIQNVKNWVKYFFTQLEDWMKAKPFEICFILRDILHPLSLKMIGTLQSKKLITKYNFIPFDPYEDAHNTDIYNLVNRNEYLDLIGNSYQAPGIVVFLDILPESTTLNRLEESLKVNQERISFVVFLYIDKRSLWAYREKLQDIFNILEKQQRMGYRVQKITGNESYYDAWEWLFTNISAHYYLKKHS
mmetsp:Transcript_4910/g.7275  ORF Transcript_4910/g.7275 Transcript_4910/m.7275 type:complete len:188 (+) Transcript_4910:45-608(+)